ncbi:methionine--tRNA ligase, mitochondrial-like [Amphiura filiformis]|uniref:methionine--tRNA ligase, mitochondrial-like n=1 Tax=Amphiura filiformis TaxID=82378 RepID=UPI003B219D98
MLALICQMKTAASAKCVQKLHKVWKHFQPVRCLSNMQTNESFLTTPIFYVNAVPHIGHLYSAVVGDAAHRWQCICGAKQAIFSTGTDEHGLKVQQAAEAAKLPPLQFCNEVSQKFKYLFDANDIAYTDYVRTTEDRHNRAVNHIWKKLYDGGYIYQGEYEGWYSTADEAFLSNQQVHDVTVDGGNVQKVSIETGNPVEWTSEKNYMFRLSQMGPQLLEWLHTNPEAVRPSKFYAITKKYIEEGLQDLSVSRQRERLKWGIPVPDDPSQTIYVWLDALVNYLTVGGYPDKQHVWPAIHIVGKDILRFHAIYWPSFLMAAGLQPPASVICHSHWTMNNYKMSKSRGNVVDPLDRTHRYTSDGLRYFLLREGTLHSDGDYNDDRLVNTLNADLGDTLGNLLSRVTAKSINPQQVFPQFHSDLFPWQPSSSSSTVVRALQEDYDLIESVQKLPDTVNMHYRNFEFHKALEAIMTCLRSTNGFVNRHQPWTLAKNPHEKPWLDTTNHVTMETLRVCGILLQPVIPKMADKLLNRLGIGENERTWVYLESFKTYHGKAGGYDGRQLGNSGGILFKKIKQIE